MMYSPVAPACTGETASTSNGSRKSQRLIGFYRSTIYAGDGLGANVGGMTSVSSQNTDRTEPVPPSEFRISFAADEILVCLSLPDEREAVAVNQHLGGQRTRIVV